MSFQQLLGIISEAKEVAKDERNKKPIECPNDGEPLQEKNGVWFCPFDGYQTRRRDI